MAFGVYWELNRPKTIWWKKGISTTHYLIEFLSFVLYNWDLDQSHAVLATLLDFSKAFNKISHNIIITRLADLLVPKWLLKVLMGFLKDRKLHVKYKGKFSKMKDMPGGGPAGTILGMVLFIVLIDPLKFGQNFSWGSHITQKLSARQPIEKLHLKYFDDLSLLEAINLKESLKVDQRPVVMPLNFHNRIGHVLDSEKVKTIPKQ